MRVHRIDESPSVLREVCKPVEKPYASIKKHAPNVFKCMFKANGVGLAANQVGLTQRFFALSYESETFIAVNPRVELSGRLFYAEEGCLSIPDESFTVPRHENCILQADDLDGNPFELLASGWLARIIQHEMDHLEGRLIQDYPLLK